MRFYIQLNKYICTLYVLQCSKVARVCVWAQFILLSLELYKDFTSFCFLIACKLLHAPVLLERIMITASLKLVEKLLENTEIKFGLIISLWRALSFKTAEKMFWFKIKRKWLFIKLVVELLRGLRWSATGDWSVLLVKGLWWDMLSWCLHWNVVVQKNVSDIDSKSQRGVWELWQLKMPCKSIKAASFLFCVALHFMWHSFKDSVCDEYYMRLKHLSSDIISVPCFFPVLFVRF